MWSMVHDKPWLTTSRLLFSVTCSIQEITGVKSRYYLNKESPPQMSLLGKQPPNWAFMQSPHSCPSFPDQHPTGLYPPRPFLQIQTLPQKLSHWTSLLVQQLRLHLPMQGTHIRSWSRKIPCATEQLSPWVITTEPALYRHFCAAREGIKVRSHAPQLGRFLQQWRPSAVKDKSGNLFFKNSFVREQEFIIVALIDLMITNI